MIDTLFNINSNQYWTVSETDQGEEELSTILKPKTWVCLFGQSYEFAKVLYFVREKLREDQEVDRTKLDIGINNLFTRYEHWTENKSALSQRIAFYFLWIIGFREKDELEHMMRDICTRAMDLDPHTGLWKTLFSKAITGPGYKMSVLREKYFFGSVINTLKKHQNDGKALCVRVGQTPDQPLTSDEDTIWASMSSHINDSIPADRIHIWLGLKEWRPLKHIEGLFDGVVIESSFLQRNPLTEQEYMNLSLLLRNKESELIIPSNDENTKSVLEKLFKSVEQRTMTNEQGNQESFFSVKDVNKTALKFK